MWCVNSNYKKTGEKKTKTEEPLTPSMQDANIFSLGIFSIPATQRHVFISLTQHGGPFILADLYIPASFPYTHMLSVH